MDDAAAIAEKLTKAQRHSFTNAVDYGYSSGGYPYVLVWITADPWPLGVAEFSGPLYDRLTPFGLAVRSHILGEKQ